MKVEEQGEVAGGELPCITFPGHLGFICPNSSPHHSIILCTEHYFLAESTHYIYSVSGAITTPSSQVMLRKACSLCATPVAVLTLHSVLPTRWLLGDTKQVITCSRSLGVLNTENLVNKLRGDYRSSMWLTGWVCECIHFFDRVFKSLYLNLDVPCCPISSGRGESSRRICANMKREPNYLD